MVIDKEFNLTYIRKEDGRIFKVKLVTKTDYSMWDTVENYKITGVSQWKLRRYFRPDYESNHINKLKSKIVVGKEKAS